MYEPTDLQLAWDSCLRQLAQDLSGIQLHIWIAPCELVAIDGTSWTVAAPDHIRSWVRDRYGGRIADAATLWHGGRLVDVTVVPPGGHVARPAAQRRGTTLGVMPAT